MISPDSPLTSFLPAAAIGGDDASTLPPVSATDTGAEWRGAEPVVTETDLRRGVVSGDAPERVFGLNGPLEAPADDQAGAVVAAITPPAAPVLTTLTPGLVADDPEVAAREMAEANRRLAIVQAMQAEMDRCAAVGLARPGWETLATVLGQSASTLRRLYQAHAAQGFAGLVPQWHKSGRKSTTDKLNDALGEDVVRAALQEIMGVALDTGSVTTGVRYTVKTRLLDRLTAQFGAERAERAVTEFRRLIDQTERGTQRRSKHAMPPSLRRAVAPATDRNQQLYHRGPRALSLKGKFTPRYNDALPGDVFSSDDTTPIWAWWVPVEWAKGNSLFERDTPEYQYGRMVLQGQYLPFIDVASNAVLSIALIARTTRGYRAGDIWSALGHVFDVHGLPRFGLQFERGTWQSKLIEGTDVEFLEHEVPLVRRVGGLRMLPTLYTQWHRARLGEDYMWPKTLQTVTSYTPNSKEIENVLRRIQITEGTIWGALGADQQRAPFERAKKVLGACNRGAADPALHFLRGDEVVKQLVGQLKYFVSEPVEGRVFRGVPQDLWAKAVAEYPLLRLPEDQRHLYRRHSMSVRVHRGQISIPGLTDTGLKTRWYYAAPFFALHEGREVLVYHDTTDVQSAVQIHAADTGEYLGDADWQKPIGMFYDTSEEASDLKRLWRETVTTYYADIVPFAPSRQLPAEIAARRAAAGSTPAVRQAPAATAPATPSPAKTISQPRRSAFRDALGED